MSAAINIALSIPDAKKSHRHFSLRLQQDIANEPVKYSSPPKILAVSGFEGDFMTMLKTLLANKVIDKYLRWTFKDGHLVIMGNCFDKEGQMVECLWLIYALEEKARKAGGYVHFLAGPHEIININGPWKHIHPKYAQSSRAPTTALYHGNQELWQWLRTKNIMGQIGDILFAPLGISGELLSLKIPLIELNNQLRLSWLLESNPISSPIPYASLNNEYCYQFDRPGSDDLVNAVLNHFKVKTIVTSHIGMDNITAFFNGKVINISIDHTIGKSEAMVIRKHRFYKAKSYKKRERLN